jgi:hypothetical protein
VVTFWVALLGVLWVGLANRPAEQLRAQGNPVSDGMLAR